MCLLAETYETGSVLLVASFGQTDSIEDLRDGQGWVAKVSSAISDVIAVQSPQRYLVTHPRVWLSINMTYRSLEDHQRLEREVFVTREQIS